ncbi:MAG TPA: arylsulfotransferase family protein, partial [Acidothermaceae bacterium]|nr:arylsulfotransferase family protein [Acidothermaceae bacterium]
VSPISERKRQIPIPRQRRAGVASVAAAVALLGAVAVALSAPPAGASAAPNAPPEVISPLPGTPDANPATQISFLGAPASRLRNIVVRGSQSGAHPGSLIYYSTHTGGSFMPSRPFDPGERVTVSAAIVGYGAPVQISTTFTVGTPYALPSPAPAKPVAGTPSTVMRFHSRHDLEPPTVTVTTPALDPTLGDIFVSPDSGPGQAGPMIVTPEGTLVWFDPMPSGATAFDLNLQTYHGTPTLTWWQGHVVEGHGQGVDMIESVHYTPIATVRAGNGLYADLHDFQITSQGTAWITAFAPEHWNLSAYTGPPKGLIDDGVVQEIDIKTGLVMFQWDALGHVAIADTHVHIPGSQTTVLDYFHVNSIDPLPDGDLLISSRNTWATYLVSETTGAVIWQLGGKHSSFTLGAGVSFAWQHDAQLLPDGTISVFNNDASPPEAKQSSVLDIALDPTARTATLVRQITYPGQGILSDSQGDVQLLPNGDDFVGWGQAGEVSEFTPTGPLTFDMHLATPASTYRAFRYPWDAQPATRPALAAGTRGSGVTELYASWNGATDVASWRVLAGSSPTTLATIGTYPSTGFETAILAPTTAPYIRVQALSAAAAVLRSSNVLKS